MDPLSVLALMEIGVLVQDRSSHIRFANPAASQLLGVDEAELTGTDWFDARWHLVDADGIRVSAEEHPVPRAIRTRRPIRDVVLGIDRPIDGDRAWLIVSAIPRLDDRGEVIDVLAVITDLDRAESGREISAIRALEAQRTLLEQITAAVPGVIYQQFVGDDGNETFPFVSDQLEQLIGVTPAQLAIDPSLVRQRMHPDDITRLRRSRRAVFERLAAGSALPGDGILDEEVRLLTPAGEWRFVELRSHAVRRVGGYLFSGFMQDVTERRRLAYQLRASQRKDVLGGLAAGIAHNFNNMLAAIVPNLERARLETTGELRGEIEDAYQAAISAGELVRQLMLVTRHEEPPAHEPVDLTDLANGVVRLCRRTFDGRYLITTAIPERPIVVRGRRSELQQVLLNLCLNARDAAETNDEPRITIRLSVEVDDAIARFEVIDNGIGMDDGVQRRIGEPFFTTKPQGRGTGLGLATAMGIVRDRGGELGFHSTPGAGATFWVTLPTEPETALVPPPAESRPPLDEFRGMTALVVDDEALVRQMLVRMLERFGFTVVSAVSGAEALGILGEGHRFSVAIVDLSMPGMSGATVLAEMREHWPHIPVVVSSGYLHDVERLREAAATIQKPYVASELRTVLRSFLSPPPR